MDVTITAIDTVGLRIPIDIWAPAPLSHGVPRTHIESLYVRVATSAGIVGWGEAFGPARTMVEAAFASRIRRLTIGQSATDRDLVARLERTLLSLGRSGPMMAALSGLDIALWDIRGKLEGAPVAALLGGAKRTHIACYASLLQYYGDTEHLKRNTTRALERGFRQVKLHERTADAVAVARGAIGPDIPLMVDANCAWTEAAAEEAVTAMAPSRPLWVEEPIYPPEDFDAAARLRKNTGIPLAMGENVTGPYDFGRMVASGAADYVQPSIVKMGGITTMAKVAAEVEAAGAICVPNVFYLGPGYLAALHCLAVKAKESPLERMFADLGATPYAKTVPIIDGHVELPRGPGLGADPEDELIAQFKI
jgi:L-alanine-DL-glutamate epimerase-like enolase superfamily enzyme